jgi:hypothetical protein
VCFLGLGGRVLPRLSGVTRTARVSAKVKHGVVSISCASVCVDTLKLAAKDAQLHLVSIPVCLCRSKFAVKESQSLVRIPDTLVYAMEYINMPTPALQQEALEELRKTVLRLHPDLKV